MVCIELLETNQESCLQTFCLAGFGVFFPCKIALKIQAAYLGFALAKVRSDQYLMNGMFYVL